MSHKEIGCKYKEQHPQWRNDVPGVGASLPVDQISNNSTQAMITRLVQAQVGEQVDFEEVTWVKQPNQIVPSQGTGRPCANITLNPTSTGVREVPELETFDSEGVTSSDDGEIHKPDDLPEGVSQVAHDKIIRK